MNRFRRLCFWVVIPLGAILAWLWYSDPYGERKEEEEKEEKDLKLLYGIVSLALLLLVSSVFIHDAMLPAMSHFVIVLAMITALAKLFMK